MLCEVIAKLYDKGFDKLNLTYKYLILNKASVTLSLSKG
jgi:hypothetical protein